MPPKPKSKGVRYLRPPRFKITLFFSSFPKRGRRYLTPFWVFVKKVVKLAKKGTEVPDPSVPMSRLEYHYREVDIYEQSSRNRPRNNKQLCGSA